MTIPEMKNLLKEELEYKKSFEATFDTACDIGKHELLAGEQFIFIGNKKKCCTECLAQITDWLEE